MMTLTQEVRPIVWKIGEVLCRTRLDAREIRKLVAKGEFPAPIVLPGSENGGKRIERWNPAKVREWIYRRAKTAASHPCEAAAQ